MIVREFALPRKTTSAWAHCSVTADETPNRLGDSPEFKPASARKVPANEDQ
jgi:hypothetical protein